MKTLKICAVLFLLFLSLGSNAQLSSIGPFVPGKTKMSIIDSIASVHRIQIEEANDLNEIRSTTLSGKTEKIHTILHSCQHNDSVVYSYSNPIDKNHTIFAIDYLSASGLLFSNVELHFWNGLLYSVQFDVNAEKFQNALSKKYGGGIVAKSESNSKKIVCRNSDGTSFNDEETSIITRYKTSSKTLSSWLTQSKRFNTDCEPIYFQYFILTDTKVDDLVQASEKKIEAAHEAAKR